MFLYQIAAWNMDQPKYRENKNNKNRVYNNLFSNYTSYSYSKTFFQQVLGQDNIDYTSAEFNNFKKEEG